MTFAQNTSRRSGQKRFKSESIVMSPTKSLSLFSDCEEILGKKPETIDELLEPTNKRRLQRHNLSSRWERKGNRAHLKINECGCTLVRAGLAKPNPVHCQCSKGLMETIFSAVCRGPVKVDMVKVIGLGDNCCEFHVHFKE